MNMAQRSTGEWEAMGSPLQCQRYAVECWVETCLIRGAGKSLLADPLWKMMAHTTTLSVCINQSDEEEHTQYTLSCPIEAPVLAKDRSEFILTPE